MEEMRQRYIARGKRAFQQNIGRGKIGSFNVVIQFQSKFCIIEIAFRNIIKTFGYLCAYLRKSIKIFNSAVLIGKKISLWANPKGNRGLSKLIFIIELAVIHKN